MIRLARLLLPVAALALALPAMATTYAMRDDTTGMIIGRNYLGTPYAIPNRTWLLEVLEVMPIVDHRLFALRDLPDTIEPIVPAPAPDALVQSLLRSRRVEVVLNDTGDTPIQAEAAIGALADQRVALCLARTGLPTNADCDDLAALLARKDIGDLLSVAEQAHKSACAEASRDCQSPNAANADRLIEQVRAAYATRAQVPNPNQFPDLEAGWTDAQPVYQD
jgi:hypothetical protein